MSKQLKGDEHSIFFALCDYLTRQGFVLDSVFDGEEYVPVTSPATAEAVVAAVDEATLRVRYPGENKIYGILLTCGEGADLVCDYSAPLPENDPHGFVKRMDEFLDWINSNFS